MRLKINLSGFLEEVGDNSALPYLLKLYLKDIEKLPIIIDPKNPGVEEITTATGELSYDYHLSEDEFYISLDYKPFKE